MFSFKKKVKKNVSALEKIQDSAFAKEEFIDGVAEEDLSMPMEDGSVLQSNVSLTECDEENENLNEEMVTEFISPSPVYDEETLLLKENTFDGLYDDIFEVELPCTMYGVHRDPHRTFIAFTLIDPITISTAKALHIDRHLRTKTIVKGLTVESTEHDDLTVDNINDILNGLDKIQ